MTIKTKPWWMWNGKDYWFALDGCIYVPKGVDASAHPDIVAHEKVHLRQQGKRPYWWLFKYAVSRKFRFAQEVEAIKTQLAWLPQSLWPALIDWYAKGLSSFDYLWAAKYDEAVRALGDGWQ